MDLLKTLVVEEEGQSMVEYGLIIAVVALVCAGTYKMLGDKLNTALQNFVKKLDAVIGNGK